MWEVDEDHKDAAGLRRYAKKHRLEYNSCFANLQKLLDRLDDGYDFPSECDLGFVRVLKKGLVEIKQKRTDTSRESRLYVYLSKERQKLYLLGIGDKDSQSDDIARFTAYIKNELIELL